MPAKPLTKEQKADAERANQLYEQWAKEPGNTQERLAHLCGWSSQSSVSQYLTGKIPLNLRAAIKLASAFEVEVRDISPTLADEQRTISESRKALIRKDSGRVVAIPQFDVAGSMGPGRPRPEQDIVVETVDVHLDALIKILGKRKISSPQNLRLITGYGPSMRPTFDDGDVLLVDTGVSEVTIDAVYVVNYKQELFIKSVQRAGGGRFLMISDNPTFKTWPIERDDLAEFQVLGRVLMAWHARAI